MIKEKIPTLYKGAGPGTHWHKKNACDGGFTPAANRPYTTNAVVDHIVHYSHPSPYISLTASFAVARQYALSGPDGTASDTNPGYVYEIDLSACNTTKLRIFNPIAEISKTGLAHEHNGDQGLVLGVASSTHESVLKTPVLQAGGRKAIPSASTTLKALVNALRDAEVLTGKVPASCIVNRLSVVN